MARLPHLQQYNVTGRPKSRIKMEFNLEYKLENLKKRAKEFFDENGEAYTGIIISIDFAKEMLEMIKELEDRVIDLESEVSVLANDRP